MYKPTLKTIKIKYLNCVYDFLRNHGMEDSKKITRQFYSKESLYWHIRNRPEILNIGLIFDKKIVGFISGDIITLNANNDNIKILYIDILCVQTKIRNDKFYDILIDDIWTKSKKHFGINDFIMCTNSVICEKKYHMICKSEEFIIPVNCEKLFEMNFLPSNESIQKLPYNPLRKISKNNINSIKKNLNNYLSNFMFAPLIDDKMIPLFESKKNIIYSFGIIEDDTVTDFVSVKIIELFCLDSEKTIINAQLMYYFCGRINMTNLIRLLIDKLLDMNVDQLVFGAFVDNSDIDITKFSTSNQYVLSSNNKKFISESYNFVLP